MNKECLECGGDPEIALIARKMGFRPDIAYREVYRLKEALKKLGGMEAFTYSFAPDKKQRSGRSLKQGWIMLIKL